MPYTAAAGIYFEQVLVYEITETVLKIKTIALIQTFNPLSVLLISVCG